MSHSMWYIHIMEYYSTIKTNKLLTNVITWINQNFYSRLKKPDTKGYIYTEETFI